MATTKTSKSTETKEEPKADKVTFEVGEGKKGPKAQNVKKSA